MSHHGKPATRSVASPVIVRVLHDRPELRCLFAIADQVDLAVRWGA